MRNKFESPEWREERDQNLFRWLRGDTEAVEVVRLLGNVAEIWDDIIDGDHRAPDREIHAAFLGLMVGLPRNRFWLTYQHILIPVILSGSLDWIDSITLEGGDAADKRCAWFLRYAMLSIANIAAYCVGGLDHAIAVGPEMRRFFLKMHFLEEGT